VSFSLRINYLYKLPTFQDDVLQFVAFNCQLDHQLSQMHDQFFVSGFRNVLKLFHLKLGMAVKTLNSWYQRVKLFINLWEGFSAFLTKYSNNSCEKQVNSIAGLNVFLYFTHAFELFRQFLWSQLALLVEKRVLFFTCY